MKKVVLLSAAFTLVGGAAMATSSFGGFQFGKGVYTAGSNNGQQTASVKSKSKSNCGFFYCDKYKKTKKFSSTVPGGGPVVAPSEVPVPAAGFLLLGGLGAFGIAKRRKS